MSIKVAVAGLGFGAIHIQAMRELSDRFQVVAVCDPDSGRLGELAKKNPELKTFTDYETMIGEGGFDAVDICSPPFLHYSQSVTAMKAGFHAIVEKPLCASLAEIDFLLTLEKQTGKKLIPICQYRYGAGYQKLLYLKGQGLCGPLRMATVELGWRRTAHYYSTKWRGTWKGELGGTLLSHGIHLLDMLLLAAGKPVCVSAKMKTLCNPVETEDSVAACLEFEDGGLASFTATLGSAREMSRTRFCFRDLSAESNDRPYDGSGEPWMFHADPLADAGRLEKLGKEFHARLNGLPAFFEDAALAIASPNTPSALSLEGVRPVYECVSAMYLSSQTGGEVRLPLEDSTPVYRGWHRPE